MPDNPKYQLGQRVRFARAYPTGTLARFGNGSDAKPCKTDGTGIVVGTRSPIMAEYKFHCGSNDPGPSGDGMCESWATGKREGVLLVATDLRRNHVYVRYCDILKESPCTPPV